MSIIVTGTIPKALKPGVKTYWGAYTEDDLLASKLVKMESTDEQFDEDVLISPFGLLKTKNEGAGVERQDCTCACPRFQPLDANGLFKPSAREGGNQQRFN